MAKATETVSVAAGFSLTSNRADSPSTTRAFPMDNSGMVGPPSLSVMVPSPVSSFSTAPEGLLRLTMKRSSDSRSLSSRVGTPMVCTDCPAGKVSVPEVEV